MKTLISNDFDFINKFWENIFIPYSGQAAFRQNLGLTVAVGSADDDALENYFFGTSSLSIDVINQMSVGGNSIDDYLDGLADEFLRIMNTRLANQNLLTINVVANEQNWRTSLRESLGTTDSDKRELRTQLTNNLINLDLKRTIDANMLAVPFDEIELLFAQNAQEQYWNINPEFRNLDLMVRGHPGSFEMNFIFRI